MLMENVPGFINLIISDLFSTLLNLGVLNLWCSLLIIGQTCYTLHTPGVGLTRSRGNLILSTRNGKGIIECNLI